MKAQGPGPWPALEEARHALSPSEGSDGCGIRIAILDSGVDTSHPDLKSLTLSDDLAIESRGGRLSRIDGEGQDVFGHGTAVAGIIHRAAPAATLGSIRVLGHFKESRAAIIQEGVKQAARLGYHILQCSFGAPARPEDAAIYKNWIDAAYLRGIHIVAAASNSSFQTREWPAHFTSVIAVGAHPKDAPSLTLQERSLVEFTISGNEKNALWPGGGTRQLLGSSFAAPRVTALLARLLSRYPDLHPATARSLLRQLALAE